MVARPRLEVPGAWPGAAIVLAVCAFVLAPTLTYRMGVDQGVFAYMGDALLRGQWPYIGSWESDFPGLMFLQAIEIAALGKSIAMFRVFDLLFQLGNAYFIYRIAGRISDRSAAVVAAVLFCLIYQGYGPWNTAQREGFGLLFVLAGFWMFLSPQRRSPWWRAVMIGLGMGVAITIKPTLLALSLFYLPLVPQCRSRLAAGLAVVAGTGLALPSILFVAVYWMKGGLPQMYEALVSYQPIYTARLRGQEPLLLFWLHKIGRLGWNAVLLPLVYAPFVGRRDAGRERLMLWLALVGAVYSVFVQGTFAGYHYLPGLAVGAILVGDMCSTASGWVLRRNPRIAAWKMDARLMLACGFLALAALFYMRNAPVRRLVTLQFLGPPEVNEFRNASVFDFTEAWDAAAYLREHTAPGQAVQIWGYESLVYYLASRPAASRFQMSHPLVMRVPGEARTPMQQRWRAEFVADMERERPAYVAVVRGDNWWWSPEERTSEELLDDFPEWKRLLARDYSLETTIGRYLIYRRTADLPLDR